jgi:hypothetical protein
VVAVAVEVEVAGEAGGAVVGVVLYAVNATVLGF